MIAMALSPSSAPGTKRRRAFTGWHMTAILVVFFGVVIAVNVLMATLAVRTFGGTVVDNSYVASQQFNGWLAQSRAQRALGWDVAVSRGAGDVPVIIATDAAGQPLVGAVVTATVRHPLGRTPDRAMRLTSGGDGRFTASAPLEAGRWHIIITVIDNGHDARFVEDWR
jgi:nitrogen fixation protein FixH